MVRRGRRALRLRRAALELPYSRIVGADAAVRGSPKQRGGWDDQLVPLARLLVLTGRYRGLICVSFFWPS